MISARPRLHGCVRFQCLAGLLFILLALLAGCAAAPSQAGMVTATPDGSAPTLAETAPDPTETATHTPQAAEPTAEPAKERELTQYELDVLFDYHRKRLEVQQRIEYTSPAEAELDEIVLMVEANRYFRTFQLQSLVVGGAPITAYELEKNVLTVPLTEPLVPGERIPIELQYTLELPPIEEPSADRRPELFGYTERQVNLVDWYPMTAVFQPEKGWLAHPAWYYGEHQVYEPAGYSVTLRLAEPVQGLVIAASAASSVQDTVYSYRLDRARNFVFSASTQYVTASHTVGDTVVTSYSFPYDQRAGEDALKYTAEALEVYTDLFGPYSQSSLSVVEADFLDGMEFEGLYFLSKGFYNIYDGRPGSYLGAIAVHETAHQWWYSQVGNDQALEPWLDEALCTYSEYLFYEAKYPEAIPWWQQVRVDYYEPEGKIDLPIYDYSGYIPYRNAVYLRGALFLHDLRQAAGDEAFFTGVRSLVEQFRYGPLVAADDFFATFGNSSVPAVTDLVAEYFSGQR